MKKCVIFLFCISANVIMAQTSHTLLMEGDGAYKRQNYTLAEESYHKSHEKERSYKAAYNLANSLLLQERYEEADGYYLESIDRMSDDITKGNAYHNLGISLFKQQKFDDSINAFKNGIRLNPNDSDIKDNLILAKLAKKQMEEQQQENQEQQEGESGEEQQEQEQQEQEQQEQQEQEQSEEEQQQQEQQEGEQQEEQDSTSMSQADPSDEQPEEIDSTKMMQAIQLSKEEAERLLQAAELEERKVQEKLKRVKSNKKKPTKDW